MFIREDISWNQERREKGAFTTALLRRKTTHKALKPCVAYGWLLKDKEDIGRQEGRWVGKISRFSFAHPFFQKFSPCKRNINRWGRILYFPQEPTSAKTVKKIIIFFGLGLHLRLVFTSGRNRKKGFSVGYFSYFLSKELWKKFNYR